MPITELLEENARKYGNDVALVEVNPQVQETRRVLWKDYDLIQPTSSFWYRREITWHVFDEKANRFAQLLMSRGVKKGDKVAILLMNCLEWLPIYFGTLKTGARSEEHTSELSGVAAHLFRHAENRCSGRAHEFPVQCGRNRILSGSCRSRCTGVWSGIYRTN